jgi:hypothetical protein
MTPARISEGIGQLGRYLTGSAKVSPRTLCITPNGQTLPA